MKRSKQEPRYKFVGGEMMPLNRKAFKLEARRLGIKLSTNNQYGRRFFKKGAKCENNLNK